MSAPVEEFYCQISQSYADETFGDVLTVTSLSRATRGSAALAMLDRHTRGPCTVADLGCGPGQLAAEVVQQGHRYIGLELVVPMFQRVAEDLALRGKARFIVGRVEQIPLANASVEAVICLGVIEYVTHPAQVLQEIRRILTPTGVAIISFPNALNPVNAVRAILRPLVAPLLRRAAPSLSRRVYVSGIPDRTFSPGAFARAARRSGFTAVEAYTHGYLPALLNHPLPRRAAPACRLIESIGHRVAPSFGANTIVCLKCC